jgi:hypothetical protein
VPTVLQDQVLDRVEGDREGVSHRYSQRKKGNFGCLFAFWLGLLLGGWTKIVNYSFSMKPTFHKGKVINNTNSR